MAPALNLNTSLTAFAIENRPGTVMTLRKAPTATPEFAGAVFADYPLLPGSILAGLGRVRAFVIAGRALEPRR